MLVYPQTFPLLHSAIQLTASFPLAFRVSCDPLSKLPLPHKLAILATMDEVSTQGHKYMEYKTPYRAVQEPLCGEEKLNKNVYELNVFW